jgi:hypothetical protein
MIATAVASGASSAASTAASQVFSRVLLAIVLGNFNPNYNKENRQRMRYIQQKYSLAYEGGKGGEDPFAIIDKIGEFTRTCSFHYSNLTCNVLAFAMIVCNV